MNQQVPLSERKSLGADRWGSDDKSSCIHVDQELRDESELEIVLCSLAASGGC